MEVAAMMAMATERAMAVAARSVAKRHWFKY
jgi:hypothetical protein